MIEDNYQFYEEVDLLVKSLAENGHKDLSEKLRDAKACSALPGEIFGEIGLSLKAIQETLGAQNIFSANCKSLKKYLKQFY